MDYRREIDGLRALAVIPVILFHAGFQTFGGGFVGVDIFFVISGYLITSIILAELEQGRFSIVNFYERRARRILPALFLVMLICIPFAWFWLLPRDMKDFSKSLINVSTFISNIYFYKQSGYFDTAAELKPLLHTWSLAVEEQFYLFFPIFLIVIWRFGKRHIFASLSLIFLVSLCYAQYKVGIKPSAAFYLLPSRFWELLIGAFSACYFSSGTKPNFNKSISEIASVIGLGLLTYAIFVFDKKTPFPSLYTLAPTVGTALIILFASQDTVVGKFLGNKLFVGIGLISYSAYLWHQPLFAFARHRSLTEPSQITFVALAIIAVVLAYFSWRYVEQPFRDKQQFSRRKIFTYAATGIVLFVAIGMAGKHTNGFEWRFSSNQREVLSFNYYQFNELYKKDICFLGDKQTYINFSKVCQSISTEDSVMIWGDSHAAALSVGLREKNSNIGQYTAGGCPPIKDLAVSSRPNCKNVNNFIMNRMAELAPNKIFLHANWSAYGRQDILNLYKSIKFIQSTLPSAEITIVGSVPHWLPDLPTYMVKRNLNLSSEHYFANFQVKAFGSLDELLRVIAKENNVKFFSALNALCERDKCLATTIYKGKPTLTAWDYGHLTEGGSLLLAEKLLSKESNYVTPTFPQPSAVSDRRPY